MAEGLVLRMDVEQFNDASAARFYDKTVWAGHQVNITSARITMRSDQFDGLYQFLLMDGANRAILDDFLTAGFINISPNAFTRVLELGEEVDPSFTMPETYPDGYYQFELEVMISGDEEISSYMENQGFFAFMENRAARLKLNLPEYVLEEFITLYMYLYAAKAAASVGQISKYTSLVNYVNERMNTWEVSYK